MHHREHASILLRHHGDLLHELVCLRKHLFDVVVHLHASVQRCNCVVNDVLRLLLRNIVLGEILRGSIHQCFEVRFDHLGSIYSLHHVFVEGAL